MMSCLRIRLVLGISIIAVLPLHAQSPIVQNIEVTDLAGNRLPIAKVQMDEFGQTVEVWNVQAGPTPDTLVAIIRFDTNPSDLRILPSGTPGAYTLDDTLTLVSGTTYRLGITETSGSAPASKSIPLSVPGAAQPFAIIRISRPALGWIAYNQCESIQAPAGTPYQLVRPILNTNAFDRGEMIVGSDSSRVQRAGANWVATYTPGVNPRNITVRIYSNREFAPGQRSQDLCFTIGPSAEAPAEATLQSQGQDVAIAYAGEKLGSAVITPSSGASLLPPGEYRLTNETGQLRGTVVVLGSESQNRLRANIDILEAAMPGERLEIRSDAARVYRLTTSVRQLPKNLSYTLIRNGYNPDDQTWPSDEFAIEITGENIFEDLFLTRTGADPTQLTRTQNNRFRAPVSVSSSLSIDANSRITLTLSDARRPLVPIANLRVIRNPTPSELDDLLQVKTIGADGGQHTYGWNNLNRIPRKERTNLSELELHVLPNRPAQTLLVSGDIRVLDASEPTIIKPTRVESGNSLPFTRFLPDGTSQTILNQPGTVIRLRVAHDTTVHHGRIPRESRANIAHGRGVAWWFDVEAFGGMLLSEQDEDYDFTPVLSPAALNFQLTWFRQNGDPVETRLLAGVFRGFMNEAQTDTIAAATPSDPVTVQATTEPVGRYGVYLGVSTILPFRTGTEFSSPRFAIVAGRMKIEGGARWFLMIQPGSIDIPFIPKVGRPPTR